MRPLWRLSAIALVGSGEHIYSSKMSARDYKEHQHNLQTLVRKRCFLTLAANSVKLHIDENKEGGAFLWIDPPWQFGRGDKIIESSASCPHHEDEDYEEKLGAWRSGFTPAFETFIEKIEAPPDGSLWIRLTGDYAFYVPSEFIPDETTSWYDHWHFRKEKGPTSRQSRRPNP